MSGRDDARRLAQGVQSVMRPFSVLAVGQAVAHAASSSYHEARENRTSVGSSLLVGALEGGAAAVNRLSAAGIAEGVVHGVAEIVHSDRLAAATNLSDRPLVGFANIAIQAADNVARGDRPMRIQHHERASDGRYGELVRMIVARPNAGSHDAPGGQATGSRERESPAAGHSASRGATSDGPGRTRDADDKHAKRETVAARPGDPQSRHTEPPRHQQDRHRAAPEGHVETRGEPARVSTYTDPDTGANYHIISNGEAKLVEPDEPGEQGGPTWTVEKNPDTGEITHMRADGESITIVRDEDVEQLDDNGSWTAETDAITGERWDVHEQDGEMTFTPHDPGLFQPQPPDVRPTSDGASASNPPVADRNQGIVRPASEQSSVAHRPEYSPPVERGRAWVDDRPPGSDLSTTSHGGGMRQDLRPSAGQNEHRSESNRTRLDDRPQGMPSTRPDAGERQQRQERDVGSRAQDARGSTTSETQRQAADERQREADRQRQQQSEQRVGGRNQQ